MRASARKKIATAEVFLRTSEAWVDRPSIYIAYTVRDEDGSPEVEAPTLSIVDPHSTLRSASCHTNWAGTPRRYFLDYCSAQGSSFPVPGTPDVQVQIGVAFANTAANDEQIHMRNITLVSPPFWYHASLRELFGGVRDWPIDSTPPTDTLVTAPTHPVYASEIFLLNVYNHMLHVAGPVDFFTFRITFDTDVVTYIGSQENLAFSGCAVGTKVAGAVTISCLSGGGAANLNGFFFLFSLSFQYNADVRAGVADTTIIVRKVELNNAGSAVLGVGELSTVYDHRGTLASGAVRAIVREPSRVGMVALPDPAETAQPYGQVFNYRVLTGILSYQYYTGVQIWDDDRSPPLAEGSAFTRSPISSCTHVSGSSYTPLAVSGRCLLQLSPPCERTF